jgi:hypothetical protein
LPDSFFFSSLRLSLLHPYCCRYSHPDKFFILYSTHAHAHTYTNEGKRNKANGTSSSGDEEKKMSGRDEDERVQDELSSFSSIKSTKLKLS